MLVRRRSDSDVVETPGRALTLALAVLLRSRVAKIQGTELLVVLTQESAQLLAFSLDGLNEGIFDRSFTFRKGAQIDGVDVES